MACLSSRVPHGTAITPELLRQIEAAEDVLVELGFRQFRVRHHGEIARLELPLEDFERAISAHEAIHSGITEAGYKFVALDLAGFRSGSLNGANSGSVVALAEVGSGVIGYLDMPSGISGDMFLGCLVDAGWPMASVQEIPGRLGLPANACTIGREDVVRGALRATLVKVAAAETDTHRHLGDIEEMIGRAELSQAVKDAAIAVFRRLARAEAHVHGTSVDDGAFPRGRRRGRHRRHRWRLHRAGRTGHR